MTMNILEPCKLSRLVTGILMLRSIRTEPRPDMKLLFDFNPLIKTKVQWCESLFDTRNKYEQAQLQ